MNAFQTEQDMTQVFLDKIDSFYPKTNYTLVEQLAGLAGRPDITIKDDSGEQDAIISIELKLRNWKRALIQAFKYRSFSHQVYVVMDCSKVNPALKNISDFKKYNIGLVSIDTEGTVNKYFEPLSVKPYSIDLYKRAHSYFNNMC